MLLVRAAMTLLAGFVTVGGTQKPLPTFASFESWSNLVRQCVVWMVRQAGVTDPFNLSVTLQELRNLQGVFGVSFHAQCQGFQALQ